MLEITKQQILQHAKAWSALPFFVALALVLRFIPASPKSLYKVEILSEQYGDLNVYDVNERPNSDWRILTRNAVPMSGFADRSVWLRVKVPPLKLDQPKEIVADIGFYILRLVEFYIIADNHLIKWKSEGLDAPHHDDKANGLSYRFAFNGSADKEMTLLVRVDTRGFMLIPFTLLDRATHEKYIQAREILTAALIGAAIGLFLFNGVLYIALRYRAYLYNSLFQLAVVGFALLGTGCFSVIVPSLHIKFDSIIRILADLVLVALITQTQFISRLMETKGNLPIFDRTLAFARFAAIAVVVLTPILPVALVVVVAVTLLVVTQFQYKLFRSIRNVQQSPYYYNIAISGGVVAGLISALAWAGFIDGNMYVERLYIIGLIWTGVFFSVSVAARVRELHSGNIFAQETIRNNGPKSRLNAILRDDLRGRKNTSDVDVTIMFIDIVSFGLLAESLESGAVLSKLTRRLDEMTKVIHSYKGTVDRSIGDGLICFFGGSGGRGKRHVVDAYNAALVIQQDTVAAARKIFEKQGFDSDDFPLPVRIGIHTDQVTIGNVGGDQSVDFTMVGSGVGFAGQLEAACAPFKIMLSEASRQSLIAEGIDAEKFQSIMFSVKNKSDLVRGYEANPFAHDPDALSLAMKMYRIRLSETQRQKRVRTDGQVRVSLFGPSGSFKIIDFSPGGFQCVSNAFVAQKSIIDLRIETNNSDMDALLNDKLMRELTIEVRWSRRSGRDFLHGFKILGANERQLALLNDILIKVTNDSETTFSSIEVAS